MSLNLKELRLELDCFFPAIPPEMRQTLAEFVERRSHSIAEHRCYNFITKANVLEGHANEFAEFCTELSSAAEPLLEDLKAAKGIDPGFGLFPRLELFLQTCADAQRSHEL